MGKERLKVSWYGERGIVNAVVSSLVEAGVPGVVAFLKTVIWAAPPKWLDDVESVEIIVEISCWEFGNPDLIIVCRTEGDDRYATFVEAKVIPYDLSAGSNKCGIRVRGFNSTINGQLSLKYRLALSLSQWNGDSEELSEPDVLYQAYERSWSRGGLGDTNRRARHLRKPNVLSLLRSAGLAGMPLSNFYFVAWTWDQQPFFRASQFHKSDQRPLFLDEDGNEQWQRTLRQIGWIGFKQIADSDKLQNYLGNEFRDALATMQDSLEPVVKVTATNELPRIIPYNILKNSEECTVRQLRAIEQLAARCFGDEAVERKAGSSSITYAGKVVLKLIPRIHNAKEHLVLAVSTSLRRNNWGGHFLNGPQLIGTGDNAQPFYILDLPRTRKAEEIASEILLDVAEICGIKTEEG